MTVDYGNRWDIKQKYGITNVRPDGSVSVRKHHEVGGLAEEFVADLLGVDVNRQVTVGGDDGVDLLFRGWKIGVKYVSWHGADIYLKVNVTDKDGSPAKDAANCDIHVCVNGSPEYGFKFVGCASKKSVLAAQQIDFGYGPKYAIHQDMLGTLDQLLSLRHKHPT